MSKETEQVFDRRAESIGRIVYCLPYICTEGLADIAKALECSVYRRPAPKEEPPNLRLVPDSA